MGYTKEKMEQYRQEYRKLRRCVSISTVPFFILAAIALLSRLSSGHFLGIPFSIAGPIAYITFLATLVFNIVIWRCPACNGFLGVTGKPKFCPKCGFRYYGGPDE